MIQPKKKAKEKKTVNALVFLKCAVFCFLTMNVDLGKGA